MIDLATLTFERMIGTTPNAECVIVRARMASCRQCSYYDPAIDNCRLLVTPQRPCNSHYKRLLQGGYGHPSNECLWNKERTSTVKE